MDASLQAHLNAMRNAGGEHPGYGIFGIPLFKDMPGFSKAQGLEDLMRMVLCLNPSGQSRFNFGNPHGPFWRLLKSLGIDLGQIFEQFKSAGGGSMISGGTHHDGPISSGLDTSRNEVGHTGSAISYDM